MKKNFFGLVIISAIVLISCGYEPPPPFYEGTPEDDSAIIGVLNTVPELLLTSDLFDSTRPVSYVPITLDPVTFPVVDSFFRADSPLIKIQPDSAGFHLTVRNRQRDLWYAKDTTCTVYLRDTFTIIHHVHWDKKYTGHYDSIKITPLGDTLRVLRTIEIDTTGGYDSIQNVKGEGLRHLFLEPVRERVIDPETQDTIYQIKEPREWILKRISYGRYYFPNHGADHPEILQVRLSLGPKVDTIFRYNADTLFGGHTVSRFRAVDSLLEYKAGDTLTVTMKIFPPPGVKEEDCINFAVANGKRVQLVEGTCKLPITGSGIVNLYFESAVNLFYYYRKPQQIYRAMAWLIPVRVK